MNLAVSPSEIVKRSLKRAGYTPQSQQAAQRLWQPLDWQRPLLDEHAFIVLLTGNAGGGKSRGGLEMVHAFMLQNPGATGLMMRKAREWTEKSIVPFMKRAVIGTSHTAEHKKGDKLFQYTNGSTLYYGGMKDDDQRESVRSIGGDGGLDVALFEEANAFTEDDFNEIVGRMRGKAGTYTQIILMTNPDSPSHWINRRLIIGQEASVYYSGAKDNPHNPPEYVDNLERLTGILYQRLVLGRWVVAEGVVYDNFEPEFNVTAEAEFDPNRAVLWGVDDGYVQGDGPGTESYHPRVVLIGQQTPMGGLNIIAEYYRTGVTSYDTSINDVLALPYTHPELAYVDSSAAMFRGALWNRQINTFAATHPVSEGIRNLRRLICDGAGVRLLHIHPRCVHLIQELQSYRYDDSGVSKSGEPKPLKVDDHGPDSLRYLAWRLRFNG